jgi:hypothetical protein
MNTPRSRVTATSLNLRSTPSSANRRNIIATLPNGQEVTRLAEPRAHWWKIRTRFRGSDLEGFVAHKFLRPVTESDSPPEERGVRAVQLRQNNPAIVRDRDGGRAHPLGEPNRPERTAASAAGQRDELNRIIDWLDVERSARYQPKSNATYCNVYAHDYCYLAGAYLPRVWWTGAALTRLAAGGAVATVYAQTVRELNANSLYEWLDDFGPNFGWERVFHMEDAQDAANEGGLTLICAQRAHLNRSGHIVAVIAEDDDHRAKRSSGDLVCPLQSQAGSRNFKRDTSRSPWWQGAQFREFGFWRHA